MRSSSREEIVEVLDALEAGYKRALDPGRGLTGGGTLLPMSDVIRLGSHAHHYLAIFDKGKALALYHTKRLASPAQRIVLHAKECLGYAPLQARPGQEVVILRGRTRRTILLL